MGLIILLRFKKRLHVNHYCFAIIVDRRNRLCCANSCCAHEKEKNLHHDRTGHGAPDLRLRGPIRVGAHPATLYFRERSYKASTIGRTDRNSSGTTGRRVVYRFIITGETLRERCTYALASPLNECFLELTSRTVSSAAEAQGENSLKVCRPVEWL